MVLRSILFFPLVFTGLFACGADAPTETYLNPHHGFSVSHPADWTRIDDRGDECKAMFLTPEGGVVNFAGLALEKDIDLALFEKQIMQQPKTEVSLNFIGISNFKLLSSKDSELGAVKARLLEFSAIVKGLAFKGCGYLAINNGRGFLLFLQSRSDDYDHLKDAFLKVAQSLKITAPDGRERSEFTNKTMGFSLKYPATWHTIELKDGWTAFFSQHSDGGEFLENIVINAMTDVVMVVPENHENMVNQGFEKWKASPGVSDCEAPNRVAVGNMQGFRYAFNQIAPNKTVIRQECYSLVKGTRVFFLVCTVPVAKSAGVRAVFDSVLKSLRVDDVPVQIVEYKSEQNGYSISYPDNWLVSEPQQNTFGIIFPRRIPATEYLYEALASVWVDSVNPNIELDRVAENANKHDATEQDYHLEEDKSVQLNGLAARRQLYTGTVDKTKIKTLRYILLGRHRQFEIEYTSPLDTFAVHLKVFEQMVSSFKLLPVPKEREEPETQKTEWNLFEETYAAVRDYLREGEILIPSDILARAELGDHFETINLDRPDSHSAYGNPDSHWFHSVTGSVAPDTDLGSYGGRDGGGRRLMVTKRCCELSEAIMKCAHAGYETKVDVTATKQQALELAKQIEMLVSTDFNLCEAASKSILKSGVTAVNTLIDVLKANKDPDVQKRVRKLLQKILLRIVLDKFRLDHPAKDDKVSPQK